MKCIPLKQATTLMKQMLKTSRPGRLVLLTRKKDRSVTLKITQQRVTLVEQGYRNVTTTYPVTVGTAKRAAQAAFKREFPRSHQVYVGE
ncbi:hypothetical protein DA798_09050 [Lactobacillus sp. PFC-70]|nr:hypothetical protein DA798_09050 [Lactobacillus sp. PFC-70]